MPVFNNILAGAAGQTSGGSGEFKIERSLRFTSGSTSYLSRTPSTAGNRRKWSWSGWVKRAAGGTYQYIWGNATSAAVNGFMFRFESDKIRIADWGSTSVWSKVTSAVYRDYSAWYHIVISYDTTNATAADRVKLFVNGSRVTDFSTDQNPTQDYEGYANTTNTDAIGRWGGQNGYYLDGLLAEVHFIDGQALAPTDFGEFDADTGVWNPIEFTGTHGPPVNQSQNWTALATGDDSSSPYRWEETFDGDASTYGAIAPQNSALNLDLSGLPGGGLSYSQSVAITYNRNSSAPDVTVNGSAIGATADGTDRTHTITGSGTLTSVGGETRSSGSYGDMSIKKIVVDGKELIDPSISIANNSFYLDFSDPSSTASL